MNLPDDWPPTGLWNGKRVDLSRLESQVQKERWCEVAVDVPGLGVVRPWRFCTLGSEVTRGDDGLLKV